MWSSTRQLCVSRRARQTRRCRQGEFGFSLIELLVVVTIIMVIAAIAIPNFVDAVANIRLRQSAGSVAGLMQEARMRAVKDNTYYTVRADGSVYAYIDMKVGSCAAATDGSGDGCRDATEPTVQLAGTTTWTSSTPPSALNSATYGLANAISGDTTFRVSFNSRGLPCKLVGSLCLTTYNSHPVQYVYYMNDSRPQFGWAAVSVSSAGRVKSWYWDGAKWEQR